MKVIIGGSQEFEDSDVVVDAIENSRFDIDEVVSPGSDSGVDLIGRQWAEVVGIPVNTFNPDWDKHGNAAGPIRNQMMVDYADAAIIVWKGEFKGTRSLIEKALIGRLPVSMLNTEADGIMKNELTEEELLRRFPEIDRIEDENIRQATVDFFLDACPDYFWTVPTSSSGKYHRHDECGAHGNHLHTKRVFSTYENLSRSLEHQGEIIGYQRQCGLAAALIHDMFKYGWSFEEGDHTVKYHDIMAAELVRQYSDLPEEVALLIDSHNGGWHKGDSPQSRHQDLFHYCDMMAADRDTNKAVHEPTEELEEVSDDLLVIED